MGTVTSDCPPEPFDPEFALRFLKWREEKRRGRVPKSGQAWRRPKTLDDYRDSILRKLKAIKRHSDGQLLAQGWSQDEEGRVIPPGWVRVKPLDGNGDSH